jgi:hypothetical protein
LVCFQLSPSCPFRPFHTIHSSRPARNYPRFRIRRSSFERRRDFNPPEQRAAQHTLWVHKTPPRPSRAVSGLPRLLSTSSAGCCFAPSAGASVPARARSVAVGCTTPVSCRRRREGLPSSWRIPVKACPGLGTPAAPGALALPVARMLPSARLTTSASATTKDFGAVSARPASSLSTLRTHQSPGEWQDSLLACQLRL